ncbi:MAG TPA: DNA repair protein RadA [Thermoanaerobaculia bacterium]|nr:DNA repair protein RadA [Thermoanaerobaculia bacterium]
MAKKPATVFTCTACTAQTPRWLGRCPECGAWNTLVEEKAASATAPRTAGAVPSAIPLAEVDAKERPRIPTGVADFDRALGGGLVPGSVVLLGGEPGIGKSTLLLQVAARLARRLGPVLYVTAEESARQVKMRADRLGIAGALASGLFLLPETELGRILDAAGAGKFGAVVVDSIQTISSEEGAGAPGSVSQVRECAGRLLTFAKTTGIPVFLIGHVTKDGTLAGPKTLEHLVDAVLSFEGERFHAHRVVRALKNRFGPVHELGVFEMTGSGLVEVANPSSLYLGTGAGSRPGSAVLAGVEGTRPLLLEVQALTVEAKYGTPRRTAIGFDGTRLALLLAVLERHGGLKLSGHDVFLNVAGGAESAEPAADLAVAAAVAGSLLGKALPPGRVVFGEIGLLGEIRAVADAPLRLKEALALGFAGAILPAGNAAECGAFPDLQVTPVRTVEELLARV